MELRQRAIVGTLWILVAGVMALTVEPGTPSSTADVARLFVIAVAVGLAALYVFDPWNVVSGTHSE